MQYSGESVANFVPRQEQRSLGHLQAPYGTWMAGLERPRNHSVTFLGVVPEWIS